MTLPQFSLLAHSMPVYIMDSTANLDTGLGTCCSSLCPALVRGQVSTPLLAVIIFFIAVAYIILNPEYSKPTHRHARARVFLALGLSGILPFSHLLLFHGPYTFLREMGFIWLLAAGVMYTTGALL
jgi:predicted membrane channel-forming protein YqfA (hemolysin III family)